MSQEVELINSLQRTLNSYKKQLEISSSLLSIERIIFQSSTNELLIKSSLMEIAKFFSASRAYILKHDTNSELFRLDVEWHDSHVIALKKTDFVLKDSTIATDLASKVKKHEPIYIADTQEKRLLASYRLFCQQKGIKSACIAGIYLPDGILYGVLCIDNPQLEINVSFIQSIAMSFGLSFNSKILKEKLEYAANHDGLTRLYNRYSFQNYIKKEIRLFNTIGIVYLDINGLKHCNDTYGHFQGDKLIKKTSSIMCDVFKEYSCFRLGGDEFAILCPDITEKKFERLIKSLENKYSKNDISISLGKIFSNHKANISELIQIADQNMYEVKKNQNKIIENTI